MNEKRMVVTAWIVLIPLLPGCVPAPNPAGAGSPAVRFADAAVLTATADSLAAARRYQEAAERYAAALVLQPDSLGIARRALGSFWRAGRYDDAYSWGQRVLASAPESLGVLFNLGVACGFLVELECVDSIFQRTLRINPAYVAGHGELAFLAQARGDLQAAVRHMEAAHIVAPNDDLAVSGLAQMLIPGGDAARAKGLMEPRIAANRQSPAYGGRSMLTLYGWALLALGDTAGATSAFDEVLGWLQERERAGQTTYQLYRERAAIHALRGEKEAATAAMQLAFDRGWRLYGSWSLPDPMFSSMMGDPEVEALLVRMRAEVCMMRQRLGLEGGC